MRTRFHKPRLQRAQYRSDTRWPFRLLVAILFSLSIPATIASQSRYEAFLSVLKETGEQLPSSDVLTKIQTYLTESNSPGFETAFQKMLDKDLIAKVEAGAAKADSIVVDGEPDDWKGSGFLVTGKASFGVIDKTKAAATPAPEDEIVAYGFVQSDGVIYCMVQPKRMPAAGEAYHYRVNLMEGNAMLYAVVWSSDGNVVQVWNPRTGSQVNSMSDTSFRFVSGSCFEARIPVARLSQLPDRYRTVAASWMEAHNIYSSLWKSDLDGPLQCAEQGLPVDLLVQYAQRIPLESDDPDPMLLATNESLIYRLAGVELRGRIIQDGLAFLDAIRAVPLPSDVDLRRNLLDRSGIYGAHETNGFFLLPDGSMSAESYAFMFLNSECISLARKLIAEKRFDRDASTRGKIAAIEGWLWKVEKYRLDNIEGIEEYCRAQPNNEFFKRAYRESLAELKEKEVNITTVDGETVNKGCVWSAPFQLHYLATHGFFYGNCIDVATVAQLFYKALGVPSVTVTYGTIIDDRRTQIHTFPLWYSAEDRLWHAFQTGGNDVPHETTTLVNVYYYLNSAQAVPRGGAGIL